MAIPFASFPGIAAIESATFTLSHGISPGVCTIEMQPQPFFAWEIGTLQLGFDGVSLAFPGCRVDSFSVKTDESGQVVFVAIHDRRWAWQFGFVSGSYNIKRDGQYIEHLKKRPQELATLLLTAMGEQGFSVTDLPNDLLPEVNWVFDNPAKELAELCESLGCRIVLQVDNTVAIRRSGIGQGLAVNEVLAAFSESADPQAAPRRLQAAATVIFDAEIPLEAVGVDTDGTIKPIGELSYAPGGGWASLTEFQDFGFIADAATRRLAQSSVYKWYRITNLDAELNEIFVNGIYPNFSEENVVVDDIGQLLPLPDFDNLKPLLPAGAAVPDFKPVVKGVFAKSLAARTNTAATEAYPGRFELDRENGIVKFDRLVWKWTIDGAFAFYSPADLKLHCVVHFRDYDTWSLAHWYRWVNNQNAYPGTPDRIIFVGDEATLYYRQGEAFNQEQVDQELNSRLAAAALEYATKFQADATYNGILPVNPDGAIQQVQWTISTSAGAETRVGRNDEFSLEYPNYQTRREREKQRDEILKDLRKEGKKRKAKR